MRIPAYVSPTVAFIGLRNELTDSVNPLGTAFFVGRGAIEGTNSAKRVFLVTARHVIEQMRVTGALNCQILINHRDTNIPPTTHPVPLDHWHVSKRGGVDVAIIEYGVPRHRGHLVIPEALLLSDRDIQNEDINLGEELFIVGLFRHHPGKERYIPIVRVGNLAAFDNEPVITKRYGPTPAYLIESRSTKGLSGSPVFLNLGVSRTIRGRTISTETGEPRILLLGLIHGHFETHFPSDTASADDIVEERINDGIAIVTPAKEILRELEIFEEDHPYVPGKFLT